MFRTQKLGDAAGDRFRHDWNRSRMAVRGGWALAAKGGLRPSAGPLGRRSTWYSVPPMPYKAPILTNLPRIHTGTYALRSRKVPLEHFQNNRDGG